MDDAKALTYILLEHNSFKNKSNWVTFLWQKQIQTIEYDHNDTKRIKKKQVTLKFYSDKNFQMILMPRVILAKFLSQKSTLLDHSYLLKYALVRGQEKAWYRRATVGIWDLDLLHKLRTKILWSFKR